MGANRRQFLKIGASAGAGLLLSQLPVFRFNSDLYASPEGVIRPPPWPTVCVKRSKMRNDHR